MDVEVGHTQEIVVEGQYGRSDMKGACGDPDVVDRDRRPRAAQRGKRAGVPARDGSTDVDALDERLGEELIEQVPIVTSSIADLEAPCNSPSTMTGTKMTAASASTSSSGAWPRRICE